MGAIRRFIVGLSIGTEFAIVILGAFGIFILSTFLALVLHDTDTRHSDGDLTSILVYEVVVLVLLLTFLRLRGWTFQRIGLRPSLKDTLIGIGLFLASYAASVAVLQVFAIMSPEATLSMGRAPSIAPRFATIVVISIVNPIFEELFVSGYVISALEGRTSAWTAINMSVGIRLLYHLYQGVLAIINVLPGGLIFAYWYVRSGRLWPLIVAHALFDFLGLLPDVNW